MDEGRRSSVAEAVAGVEPRSRALLRDLRDAVRALAARPLFTVASLLLLVLGLGAATAVFGAVRQLLLAPLAFPEADRLVLVWRSMPDGGRLPFAPDRYAYLADDNAVLSGAAAYVAGSDVSFAVGAAGDDGRLRERVPGALVSADFFSVLGASPLLGRTFGAREGLGSRAPVVVLAEPFWRRRFAADPAVVGRTLDLNGLRYTVIGVVSAEQAFPPRAELWIPDPTATAHALGLSLRVTHYVQVVARLAPGIDVETARRLLAEADAAFAAADESLDLVPLDRRLRADVAPLLLALAAAVATLLLLICSNLAHLQLVRTAERRRELALRLALGAERGSLVRRLLFESLLLALVGGTLGVGLAVLLLHGFGALAPAELGRPLHAEVDGWLVAAALGLALAAALLFGLVPSLYGTRGGRLLGWLASGGSHATQAPGGRTLRRLLVTVELALSLVLVVAAALMIGSFVHLVGVDLGVDADGVVELAVRPASRHALTPAQQAAVYDELLARLAALPGVAAVGGADVAPLDSGGFETVVAVEGVVPAGGGGPSPVLCRSLAGSYLAALRVPWSAGRPPRADGEAGAVVDEAFARRFFGGAPAVGRRLSVQGRELTVTGVVANVHQGELRETQEAQIYLPYRFSPFPWPELHVVLRAADPAATADRVRRAVAQVPAVELTRPPSLLRSRVDALVARERFALWIFVVLAVVSGLLTASGTYAVTAYLLARRRREIGIRIALGATRWTVLRLVLREVLLLAAAGLAAGAAVAALTSRFLAHLLYAVAPLDPLLYALAAALLAAVAAAAGGMAGRRAARLDVAAVLSRLE